MQPYFFPYLGYFDLLNNVDLFIIYDTVQFIKRGWINRNRILHPNKTDWQYITIPIDGRSFSRSLKTPILDIKISNNLNPWKKHLLGQLVHYKNKAPRAQETISFVEGSLAVNEITISRLNIFILEQCTKLLNINFEYRFCSELGIELNIAHSAEDRILDLCEFLGTNEYINLPGGVALYHPDKFKYRNIKLTFRNLPALVYQTEPYVFEPNLSIIDLLMWNKPEVIKKYLDENRNTGIIYG
jgi:hypothetical protein